MHESEKWKWSRSVLSDSSRPPGLQPTRLLHPWDFPGKSTGVGCHCLLQQTGLRITNLGDSPHLRPSSFRLRPLRGCLMGWTQSFLLLWQRPTQGLNGLTLCTVIPSQMLQQWEPTLAQERVLAAPVRPKHLPWWQVLGLQCFAQALHCPWPWFGEWWTELGKQDMPWETIKICSCSDILFPSPSRIPCWRMAGGPSLGLMAHREGWQPKTGQKQRAFWLSNPNEKPGWLQQVCFPKTHSPWEQFKNLRTAKGKHGLGAINDPHNKLRPFLLYVSLLLLLLLSHFSRVRLCVTP